MLQEVNWLNFGTRIIASLILSRVNYFTVHVNLLEPNESGTLWDFLQTVLTLSRLHILAKTWFATIGFTETKMLGHISGLNRVVRQTTEAWS